MSFYPAIQNFTSASTSSVVVTQCALDWQNVYPYQQGSPFQITRFNFATGAQLSTGNMPGTSSNGSCVIDPLGFLYARHSLANYNGISQANGATYVLTGSFGTDSSFIGPPIAIPCPSAVTIIKVGSNIWMITTALIPIGTDQHSISAVLVGNTTLTYAGHLFSMQGGSWSICAGPQGTSSATAYTIAGPSGTVPTPNTLALYQTVVLPAAVSYVPPTMPPPTSNPFINSSLIVSIAPSDIDLTWSNIFHNGICYDATDGNVIVSAHTGDAVTTQNYMVKLRVSDGVILWKVPLPGTTTNSSFQMPLSRIRHGTFAVAITVGSVAQTVVIDTITGTFTSSGTGMASLFLQGQCYDDTTGAIVCYTNYSAGVGAPTQLGSTPASFTGWAALYVQPVYQPPPRARTYQWGTYYLPLHHG